MVYLIHSTRPMFFHTCTLCRNPVVSHRTRTLYSNTPQSHMVFVHTVAAEATYLDVDELDDRAAGLAMRCDVAAETAALFCKHSTLCTLYTSWPTITDQ